MKKSLWSRVTRFRRRHLHYPNLAMAPLWVLLPLVAACWFIVWGTRLLGGASVVVISGARKHGASPDAVFLASLYVVAVFGFAHWYHHAILKKYLPTVRKRLIP